MTSFEAVTASRELLTHGFVEKAQTAASKVLGDAIEFPAEGPEARGDLVLLGEEELALMQKMTDGLGRMSIKGVMKATASQLPPSFQHGSRLWVSGIPKLINVQGVEGKRRELVLPLSLRGRFIKERRAFMYGVERATGGIPIPWLRQELGVKVGNVRQGVKLSKKELVRIGELGPQRARFSRGKTKRTLVQEDAIAA